MTSEFNLICRNTVVLFFPFPMFIQPRGVWKWFSMLQVVFLFVDVRCRNNTCSSSVHVGADREKVLIAHFWLLDFVLLQLEWWSDWFRSIFSQLMIYNENSATDAGDSHRQTSHSQTATPQTFGTAYFLFKRVSWVPCGTMLRLWSLIWLSCPARRCHISYYWWFHAGSN